MGDFEAAGTEFAPASAMRLMREAHEDSGSRSAAGVAAYPTRPPEPVDSRAHLDRRDRALGSTTGFLRNPPVPEQS